MWTRWRSLSSSRIVKTVRFLSQHSAGMNRDYNAAIQALNTLQSNFAIVDKIRKSGRGMNQDAIPEMIQWCRRIGYEPSDLNRLGAIHVAGTKGKGSTSSFVSSILSEYTKSVGKPHKVGLYTSPHLRFVRERIRIDNEPLSEDQFAKYFFETWDRLEASARSEGHHDPSLPETKPVYFRFLTLMAFHCYLCEGVDAAVIECGIGGEYDSTNILVEPIATGVSSLGIDHTAMLGDTIESIAWHKAGVFKRKVPAISVEQPDSALQVLRKRAMERGTELKVVGIHPAPSKVNLGVSADFQKMNASLAIALASSYLRSKGVLSREVDLDSTLPDEFRRGLENGLAKGRCETRPDTEANLTWFLDGGHTLESIDVAGKWFASILSDGSSATPGRSGPRILIFNQQTRDADALAQRLYTTLASALVDSHPFTHVVFCTNTTYTATGFRPDLTSINTNADDLEALKVQNALAKTWEEVDAVAEVKVVRTIEEAVTLARSFGKVKDTQDGSQAKVLVTGSLHLVGGLIEVLESETERKTNGK